MKKFYFLFSFLAFLFASFEASAATVFDTLTQAISFTDMISALTTVYSGLVVVGIFLMGARLIMSKLGMSK